MGACATKPKVLTDAGQAPAPDPDQSAKEEDAVVAGEVLEAKEGKRDVIVEEEEVVEREIKVKEIVGEVEEEEKVDDQSSKRQSLSYLLQESEEGTEPTDKHMQSEEGTEPTDKLSAAEEVVKQETSEAETPIETVVEEQPLIKKPVEPTLVDKVKEEVEPEPAVVVEQSATPMEPRVENPEPELAEPTPPTAENPEVVLSVVDTPSVVEASSCTD